MQNERSLQYTNTANIGYHHKKARGILIPLSISHNIPFQYIYLLKHEIWRLRAQNTDKSLANGVVRLLYCFSLTNAWIEFQRQLYVPCFQPSNKTVFEAIWWQCYHFCWEIYLQFQSQHQLCSSSCGLWFTRTGAIKGNIRAFILSISVFLKKMMLLNCSGLDSTSSSSSIKRPNNTLFSD